MPNKFAGEWNTRPKGAEEYDYVHWSPKRRAWEFLRRSEAYQQSCRACASVSRKKERADLAEEHAERWHIGELVPFQRDWPEAKKCLRFVMYGPNYLDPKEESQITLPKTYRVAFFRVNVEAAIEDKRLIELQLKNIERRALRFREILRKKFKFQEEGVKAKPVTALKKDSKYYVKYLRALDIDTENTRRELWEKLHKKDVDSQTYDPPLPSELANTSKHLATARQMAGKGYLKFIVMRRMEKIRPKRNAKGRGKEGPAASSEDPSKP